MTAIGTTPPRSVLAVPASKPRLLDSARRSSASVLMIDLEDGVAPDHKATARTAAISFLDEHARDHVTWVRVNDPSGPWGAADLAAVVGASVRPAAVVLPKADLASLGSLREAYDGPVVGLVETASGVEQCAAVAAAPGVLGLAFGPLDYAVELGRAGGLHAAGFAWAAGRLVNAAAAGGGFAVAGPSAALEAGDELSAELAVDRVTGFCAKLCIHPAQIATVEAAFAPTTKQLAHARRVLGAVGGDDHGAVRVDGRMIDRPVVELAHLIVTLHAEVAS